MLVVLAGDGTILGDTTTWVAVSFIALVGVFLYFGVPGLVARALDERAEDIRRELDEARKLRDAAQDLLADYQRKAAEADAEAKAIIDQARKEAEALANETRRGLDESLERRTRMAEEKIARAEQQALGEVQVAAVEAAISASGKLLQAHVTPEINAQLVDASIKDLRGKLN